MELRRLLLVETCHRTIGGRSSATNDGDLTHSQLEGHHPASQGVRVQTGAGVEENEEEGGVNQPVWSADRGETGARAPLGRVTQPEDNSESLRSKWMSRFIFAGRFVWSSHPRSCSHSITS